MKDFLDRVKEERAELDGKIEKLVDFMHSDKFEGLEPVQQGLLMVQLEFMRGYSGILLRRIESNQ